MVDFQQEKLEIDKGSYVKSVLARLKDKKKSCRGITDAMGDACLLKTESAGGEGNKLQEAQKCPVHCRHRLQEIKYLCVP